MNANLLASKQARLTHLDFYKGVCILFIIFTHYKWSDEQRLQYLFPFWIEQAVPVFMVITGYLSARTYSSLRDAYKIKSILRKWLRLVVPFAMAFIIQMIISVTIKGDHYTITKVIGKFIRGGEGPGSYYFPVMMQIVIIAPLIVECIKKWESKGLVICFIINLLFEMFQTLIHLNGEIYRLLCFRYLFIVSYGIWLYFKEEQYRNGLDYRKKNKAQTIGLIIVEIIGILVLVIFNYTSFKSIITHEWKNTTFVGSLYIVPIMAILIWKTRIHFKPIEILGKASFNVFLVQMLYYWCLSNSLYEKVDIPILQIIINIVLCCIVGIVFYYVEQPITRWIIKSVSRALPAGKSRL